MDIFVLHHAELDVYVLVLRICEQEWNYGGAYTCTCYSPCINPYGGPACDSCANPFDGQGYNCSASVVQSDYCPLNQLVPFPSSSPMQVSASHCAIFLSRCAPSIPLSLSVEWTTSATSCLVSPLDLLQLQAWNGLLPDGSSAVDPSRESGFTLSTPPVTLPAASISTLQNLAAFVGPDGTLAASALNSLLGASVRMESLQVGLGHWVRASLNGY